MVALHIFTLAAALASVSSASPIVARDPTGVWVHPGGNTNLCLTADADENKLMKSVTLQTCQCGNTLQLWVVNPGKTKIALASNTGLCVVGGINPLRGWFPGDGVPLLTWICGTELSDGSSTWDFHDGRFQTTGKNSAIEPQPADNFCMDATNGAAAGVVLQYWTCYDNNPNQQWTTT